MDCLRSLFPHSTDFKSVAITDSLLGIGSVSFTSNGQFLCIGTPGLIYVFKAGRDLQRSTYNGLHQGGYHVLYSEIGDNLEHSITISIAQARLKSPKYCRDRHVDLKVGLHACNLTTKSILLAYYDEIYSLDRQFGNPPALVSRYKRDKLAATVRSAFNNAGTLLALGKANREIDFVRVANGELIRSVTMSADVSSFRFDKNGEYLFVGLTSGELVVVEITKDESFKIGSSLWRHGGEVTDSALTPNTGVLWTISNDGYVVGSRLDGVQLTKQFLSKSGLRFLSVDINERFLVIADNKGKLYYRVLTLGTRPLVFIHYCKSSKLISGLPYSLFRETLAFV
mmetsp:Transcript_45480/g.52355  ORF Transcript_45480/g.52355 Transcript_45480/m.52355 type:complete len:340 (-) Transcript_45480:190-1209(-)